MPTPPSFGAQPLNLNIDEKDRERIWQVLRQGDLNVMPNQMNAFVVGIQTALTQYGQYIEEDHRRRSAREDLRDLFMACADERNAEIIRRKFPRLPALAREELVRRAKARDKNLDGTNAPNWGNLCNWVKTCSDEELLDKLPSLISAGRALSLGQLRKNGKRSAPHVEPLIMGETLRLQPPGEPERKGVSSYKGGHPADEGVDELVRNLALLWLELTGETPRSSRSQMTPFGRLAHFVLKKADARSPENALRRFRASVKHHRARPSSIPVCPVK